MRSQTYGIHIYTQQKDFVVIYKDNSVEETYLANNLTFIKPITALITLILTINLSKGMYA